MRITCAVHKDLCKFMMSLCIPCSMRNVLDKLLLLVFSPWAGLGRDQSSVRRLVWLWYAASWASLDKYCRENQITHFAFKFFFPKILPFVGRVAQSVQQLPTGWKVRGSNPGGARFSEPVLTGPEAHPASCTMGTGSFPGVRCCRGVTLTPHPLLVQRSKTEQSYTSSLPKGLRGL